MKTTSYKTRPFAPSFAPYYVRAEMTEAERSKLLEAIKTDENIKQERLGGCARNGRPRNHKGFRE